MSLLLWSPCDACLPGAHAQCSFQYHRYPSRKPDRFTVHLQTDAEKEVWVDPQDAFHNYRLLTAGRECFVVSCAWQISNAARAQEGQRCRNRPSQMLNRLLRCTALFPPVSSPRPWLLSVQLVQRIMSNLIFCLLLTAECLATVAGCPSFLTPWLCWLGVLRAMPPDAGARWQPP